MIAASGMDFLAGSGEMGERIRAFDWARTPLGPIDTWPQSLKTSVSLILSSRHPMWIGWGPEMTFLYNDAYVHVLGAAKHPGALGLPASKVWAEIWHICGPLADKVFTQGEATFLDDVRLFMNRGRFLEETFYSFSYSPIRDDQGRVCGLFCPSADVTPKVLNARRMAILSELAANALVEKTTRAACAAVARTLGKNPDDVPFALLYLVDAEGRRASVEQAVGAFGGGFENPSVVDLERATESPRWPVADVYRSGRRQTIRVDDVKGLPLGVANQPVAEALVLPVSSHGEHKPYGVLVAGVNPCRPLDADHLTFFELVASQVASAIHNSRALEEEKKRADMLAEIDRAKTVFFSNVSHEFRTPLTLMLGPLENLLAKPEGLRREDQENLAVAHRNSLRLLKLVNSLLDFSRLEAGRLKASYAATDLAALTTDLASHFQSAVQAAGLSLNVDCAPLPAPVYIDPDMWEKIVLNLLSNAFKFTFEGQITVRLRAEGDHAVLTVSDTGIGIPEAELPRIFERFHRVEGAKGRTYEGTGIGLALIQEYVRLHAGSISVASREGEGSTFTVTLPFGTAHLPSDRITEVAGAAATPAGRALTFTGEAMNWLSREADPGGRVPAQSGASAKARILLADDNADMREHVTRLLGRDYEVTTARDGQEALERVRQNPPDLLLSDVMMPVLDGIELVRALRGDPETQTLPVILLSARAAEEMRVEGLEAGADDYLVKPFTAAELLARVSTHVQMAAMRRQAMEREAALRAEAEAARDRAVAVLESITDGFIALDSEWRVTYVNGEAERLNGIPREQMVGKNHWDLFPASVGTMVQRELVRAAKERVSVDFEYYYAPWRRWFHVKAYPASGGGLSLFFEDVSARKAAEDERAALLQRESEARAEAETLNEVSRALAGELDLEKLVQTITHAATRITGAKFGAFFYNVVDGNGEAYSLYTLSGAPREAFEKFGLPRATPLFEPTFRGLRVVRSDDVLQDPNYGAVPPHHGMPKGHLPVRSYLAVPVVSRTGEVLGGLFFGHPEPAVFDQHAERMAVGIASHAAVAIDNARLFAKAEREIEQRGHTEDLLRQSEQQFREMIDALPTAIYTTDAEGFLTHYNPAAVQLAGREIRLGSDRWTIAAKLFRSDGEPVPLDQSPMATALGGGTSARGAEYIGERPDGSRFWFTPYPTPLRDHRGRVTGGINMLVDITGRKEAERDTLLLGAIVDSSDDAIVSKDLNGIVTSWNKGAERLFGYTAEEMVGRSIITVVPSDRLDEEYGILSRLKLGQRIDHFETIRRHKDGTLLDISLTISPVKDAQGRIIGASKIARDISDRKRAEAALLASEARFRQLADAMPQIVWTARPDGYVDYYNERWYEFSGFTRDAFGDRSWQPIIHPDDAQPTLDAWHQSVETGQPYRVEYRFRDRAENRWRWFMGRALPVQGSDGRIVKWFGSCIDIDEQKRVEAELRRANQDLEQFAYSASHDLQEPLRSIKIYGELLARRYADRLDGQAFEFLNFLLTGATRMEVLVRDLLAYTQIKRLESPTEPADSNEALAAALANLSGATAESGATVTFDDLPSVRVHSTHLRQLFQNLIGNAIKYRSPKRPPVIHVSCERRSESYLFSVRDNGIGIEPEYKEHIFGLFKRLHTGDEYSGTGIGLAICQRIAERYHGRIWVESHPGEGSTFIFEIPV
jgi:PAS domain S-box-containing protein